MKTLFALAIALFSVSAHAELISAQERVEIPALMIQESQKIPETGDLAGRVTSQFIGSAYGLTQFVVVVDNGAGGCEDDGCTSRMRTFVLYGSFTEPSSAVYSRKIDKNTYSIAIFTTQVVDLGPGSGDPVYKKVKILLTVKMTKEGVAEEADMKVVNR